MPIPTASSALTRFTVLDLTRVRAGPTAARQLADWGANVIKVELPEHQEPGDAMGGPRHGPDFQNLHRNKRAITLDLKGPRWLTAKENPGRAGNNHQTSTPPGVYKTSDGHINIPTAGAVTWER